MTTLQHYKRLWPLDCVRDYPGALVPERHSACKKLSGGMLA